MLRGVRGATTVNRNKREEILNQVTELLEKIIKENAMRTDDIAAIILAPHLI